MPQFKKYTISNLLIIISIIFTFIWYFYPIFISEWSINSFYLKNWNLFHYFIQFFTGTFIHWWIMHLLFNSMFIYYFWNLLEIIIWRKKYIIFFITSVIFIWILLTTLINELTIWISWFAMALLSYYTLELKSKNNLEYKWWITALVINILIWLYPWISLFWHIFWAIFWIVFFYLSNDFTQKKLIWLFNYKKNNTAENNYWILNTKKD